jgi:predicted RNase H-like HicB family nuclease
MVRSVIMTFTRQVVVHADEDGGYWVEVPSLPGCISEGDTLEEALENIKDAIQGYIASLQKHGDPIPDENVVTVTV